MRSNIGKWSHRSHQVTVAERSLLHEIAGVNTFKTNSFHHQSVKEVPNGFIASAHTSDGIIEAIERVGGPFTLGVQWHCERCYADDAISREIFHRFIAACR